MHNYDGNASNGVFPFLFFEKRVRDEGKGDGGLMGSGVSAKSAEGVVVEKKYAARLAEDTLFSQHNELIGKAKFDAFS